MADARLHTVTRSIRTQSFAQVVCGYGLADCTDIVLLAFDRQQRRAARSRRDRRARFLIYDVALDEKCVLYCERIMTLLHMVECVNAAKTEPDEVEELDAEF